MKLSVAFLALTVALSSAVSVLARPMENGGGNDAVALEEAHEAAKHARETGPYKVALAKESKAFDDLRAAYNTWLSATVEQKDAASKAYKAAHIAHSAAMDVRKNAFKDAVLDVNNAKAAFDARKAEVSTELAKMMKKGHLK